MVLASLEASWGGAAQGFDMTEEATILLKHCMVGSL